MAVLCKKWAAHYSALYAMANSCRDKTVHPAAPPAISALTATAHQIPLSGSMAQSRMPASHPIRLSAMPAMISTDHMLSGQKPAITAMKGQPPRIRPVSPGLTARAPISMAPARFSAAPAMTRQQNAPPAISARQAAKCPWALTGSTAQSRMKA